MTSFTTRTNDGIARLELNLPGEPVNKISRTVRKELEAVLDSVASASAIRAVVLISGKPESFIAGADIDEFVALETREEALALVERGQELINRMENLGNRCSPLSMAGISGEASRPLSPARIASPRITPKRYSASPRSSSESSLPSAGVNGSPGSSERGRPSTSFWPARGFQPGARSSSAWWMSWWSPTVSMMPRWSLRAAWREDGVPSARPVA